MSRKHNIRVTAIEKQPEDRQVRLYVLALLELARRLVEEEEKRPAAHGRATNSGGGDD